MKHFLKLLLVVILTTVSVVRVYGNSDTSAILDSLVEKGVLTEQEAIDTKKLASAPVVSSSPAQRIRFLQFWHVRYQHMIQDDHDGVSFDKGNFALRRIVPVFLADITENTRYMLTLYLPSSSVINTMRLTHDVDTEYLKGSFWVAHEAMFFCMEEFESGTRIMTPDRSIINMYFGDGDHNYSAGEKRKYTSTLGFSGYHTGVSWHGRYHKNENIIYRVQIVNSKPQRIDFDGANGIAVFATLGYNRGGNYDYTRWGINFGYSSRVVSAISGSTLPSKVRDYGDCVGINPYFWWSNTKFTLQSEFVLASAKYGATLNDENPLYTTKSPRASPWAYYILTAYKFDINPFGELEPLFRYTYMNTDGRGVNEGSVLYCAENMGGLYNKVDSFYVGTNWYLQGNNIKYQLGIEYARFRDAPSGLDDRKSDVLMFILQMQLFF
ncbi:MAG: hypothetical protein E7035_05600 [Verrucomicrobiaceae bacterium]|nr:hypothetical protein [Verrucomicrobiaceae bacterium]